MVTREVRRLRPGDSLTLKAPDGRWYIWRLGDEDRFPPSTVARIREWARGEGVEFSEGQLLDLLRILNGHDITDGCHETEGSDG